MLTHTIQRPQAKHPKFSIEVIGHQIHAELYGVWNMAIDVKFVLALEAAIQQVNHAPWSLFVDMHECIMAEDYQLYATTSGLDIERTNQQAEAWLVNRPDQAEFLLKFFEQQPFDVQRFECRNAALEHIQLYSET